MDTIDKEVAQHTKISSELSAEVQLKPCCSTRTSSGHIHMYIVYLFLLLPFLIFIISFCQFEELRAKERERLSSELSAEKTMEHILTKRK